MTMTTAEATELREILRKGREITTRAVAEKRELTAAEHAAAMDALDAAAKANDAAKSARPMTEAEQMVSDMFAGSYKGGGRHVPDPDDVPSWERHPHQAKTGHLSLRLDAKAARQAVTSPSGRVGIKALLQEGMSLAAVSFDSHIVVEGRPASSVLDLLPVVPVSEPNYSYLRQTSRDDKAAPVAPGDLKPTSNYGLTRVDGKLKVIAHLSEPIHKFDLDDLASLETFLRVELMGGLNNALVSQVFNGTGTGEEFTGLANTSGILTQAFATDTFTTLRRALTTLEVSGQAPNGVVMHPSAWESIELAREDGATGGFLLGNAPVDVATRRLWGLPVAVTPAVPAAKAWVLSEGSAHIRVHEDDPGAVLEWGMVGDDFARNQVRARAELRADLSVERPAGIVNVSLSA